MKALCIILSAILCLSWSNSLGATWYIKSDGTGDAPTIQAGIDSALDGDTVLLAAGTYTGVGNRNIDFLGKTITVTSESGPEVTVIDCEGAAMAFVFSYWPSYSPVLSRLTIQNATTAIFCDAFATPTIADNIFVENTGSAIRSILGAPVTIRDNTFIRNSGSCGGAIQLDDWAWIYDNVFIDNSATGSGGAICCIFTGSSISGNVFIRNTAGQTGGAIYLAARYTVDGNTLYGNGAPSGGGIYLGAAPDDGGNINNNIIAFGTEGAGIECAANNPPRMSCNDIFGNAGGDAICGTDSGGNFSADPQFCGVSGSDIYDLQSDSPCAPGNHPYGDSCGLIGALPVGCGPVPTMLQSFDAAYRGAVVELSWRLSEIGRDSRFFVLRSEADSPFTELHAARVEIDGLKGAFTDRATEPGRTYRYRVDVSDEDGRQTLFTTQEITLPATALTLGPAQPNPFNPQTTIHYTVPEAAHVRLAIYDARGKLVRTLVDGAMPAGVRSTTWNGRDNRGGSAPSGVYFVRLTSGKQVRTSKIVLLK